MRTSSLYLSPLSSRRRHCRRAGDQTQTGTGRRQGGGQLPGLPYPRLYPDELALSQRGGLEREVTKMIKALGAPIDDADAKVIADY